MINYRVVRKMCVKNLQGKSTKESKGPLLPATSLWDPPGQLRLSLGGQRQMSGLHACLGAFLLSPPLGMECYAGTPFLSDMISFCAAGWSLE